MVFSTRVTFSSLQHSWFHSHQAPTTVVSRLVYLLLKCPRKSPILSPPLGPRANVTYFRIYGSSPYAVPNCVPSNYSCFKKILKRTALGPHVILISHNSVAAWAQMGGSHLESLSSGLGTGVIWRLDWARYPGLLLMLAVGCGLFQCCWQRCPWVASLCDLGFHSIPS